MKHRSYKKLSVWLTIIGPIVGMIWIVLLRNQVDLRDRPGAAGTLSIYRASPTTPTAKDWSAQAIELIHHQFNTPLDLSSSIVSLSAVIFGLFGLTAAGYAMDGKRGALGAGLLGACWPLTIYMGILDGVDPMAFGLAWLAVGCCWLSGINKWWGIVLGLVGGAAAPFAISLKETALPAVALCALSPIFFRPSKWLIITVPATLYSLYWSYAWFWPDEATRLDTEIPDAATLRHGWYRLKELAFRGLPEGKFDQFLLLAFLSGLVPVGAWWRRLLIAFASGAALCFTAHTLDELVRPRYLATAMLGCLACSGAVLGVLTRYRGYLLKIPLIVVVCLCIMDSWSFFVAWTDKRVEVTGAQALNWPKPPSTWSRQFKNMTDLTLRDLTLWGGVELAELTKRYPNGLAIPRLRDDRHRSLSGLAEIHGAPHVIVDPGNCCTGRPADTRCAIDIVERLQKAGVGLVIPTEIKGVQRGNRFEEKWTDNLRSAMSSYDTIIEHDFWILLEAPMTKDGDLPCKTKAPFRRPR